MLIYNKCQCLLYLVKYDMQNTNSCISLKVLWKLLIKWQRIALSYTHFVLILIDPVYLSFVNLFENSFDRQFTFLKGWVNVNVFPYGDCWGNTLFYNQDYLRKHNPQFHFTYVCIIIWVRALWRVSYLLSIKLYTDIIYTPM